MSDGGGGCRQPNRRKNDLIWAAGNDLKGRNHNCPLWPTLKASGKRVARKGAGQLGNGGDSWAVEVRLRLG